MCPVFLWDQKGLCLGRTDLIVIFLGIAAELLVVMSHLTGMQLHDVGVVIHLIAAPDIADHIHADVGAVVGDPLQTGEGFHKREGGIYGALTVAQTG